jgi:hypothetical protein
MASVAESGCLSRINTFSSRIWTFPSRIWIFPSRIRIRNNELTKILSILNPKNFLKLSEKSSEFVDHGSRIQWTKKALDAGSGSATLPLAVEGEPTVPLSTFSKRENLHS